jgi:hypothetical protein
MSVCVVNVDEGSNEGVCDDVLDMEKIVTEWMFKDIICELFRQFVHGSSA